MNDLQRRTVRQEHGPKDFYYSMLPDSKPHPVVKCLCGWMPELIFDSWEEAGKALDVHIVASLRKDDLVYHATLSSRESHGDQELSRAKNIAAKAAGR
jgi:hypothetical protein